MERILIMKVELSHSHLTYKNSTTCFQYKKNYLLFLYYSIDFILVNCFIWCPPKKQKNKTEIQSHVRESTQDHIV